MPVKEEEIRKGNWFNHLAGWSYRTDKAPTVSKYFQWDSQDWYQMGECCLSLDYIEPIHISSEILEASGFQFDEDKRWWYYQPEMQNIHFRIMNTYDDVWLFSKGFFNWNNELNEGRYVHNMQNVFYIILDHELEIKFP